MRLTFILVGGLVLCLNVRASGTGTVMGTVTDPTGAVIPGARVSLTNSFSVSQQSVLTDQNGRYKFTNVPFGRFVLKVEASGFSEAEYAGELNSTVPPVHEIHYKSVTQLQQVTLVGSDLLVETDSSGTQHDLESEQVEKMPMAPPRQWRD